jgi:hypothetical protein
MLFPIDDDLMLRRCQTRSTASIARSDLSGNDFGTQILALFGGAQPLVLEHARGPGDSFWYLRA